MLKGRVKEKAMENYIPKPKNPKPSAKERTTKDDTCHHCKKVGHWKRNCPVYLDELIKKKKQVDTANSSNIFTIELFSFLNKSWVYDTGCGTHICNTKQGLRGERKLKQGALYLYVGNGVRAQVKAIGTYTSIPQYNGVSERRNHTLLDMVRSMMNLTTLPLSFWDYAIESVTRILNMVLTKKVNKTPYKLRGIRLINSNKDLLSGYPKEMMGYYFYFLPENKIIVARYAEFLEKNLISQEVSGRAVKLEEIQDEDTSPSENTTKIPMEVEGFKPPQEEVVTVCVTPRQGRNTRRNVMGIITTQWCQQ
ncbi:retrotransposon protein, putative, ty1-copia subclass [Tanacetum coccineum]|uniref:Retrotransposon protein, putative, ty1-copia subclass n=1 Tax=Tanacetum coccineum TaxID=301880 RepID=A0ABQ4Y3V6_9ASTR